MFLIKCSLCIFILNQLHAGASAMNITELQYASMPILFHFDDYDRCMLYGEDANYCSITFQLYPHKSSNISDIWKVIEEVSSKPSNYRHDILRHGVCIPETCPNIANITIHSEDKLQMIEYLTKCYNKKYFHWGLKGKIIKIHCQNQKPPYVIDIYDILFAISIISYTIFVICASLYEGTARYKSEEEYAKITGTGLGKFLSAFSIPKNCYRLADLTRRNPDQISLRCIQGIRFYNMMFIILAHTVMVQFATPVSNPIYTEMINTIFLNTLLTNGGYAVQTFFLISAWLLTYNVFISFEGERRLRIRDLVNIVVLRYARLTPTLAVVVAFHCTWLVHIARGPFWDKVIGEEYRNCRQNWWTNLLYVNNHVNKENMCLQHTWYLACDMQLFLLSLLVIFLMKTFEKYSKHVIAFMMVIGILIPATISYIKKYDILIRQYPEPFYNYFLFVPQWHVLYSSSYSNITGYAIGIMFGYIFYKIRRRNVFTSKLYVVLWWIFSFGLPLSIIFVAARMYHEDYVFTRLESSLYWGFGKYVFGLGLGIGIFGMTQNVGWFCPWVCRWTPVQILGRLTFSAYLVHVALIKIRAAVNHQPLYTTNVLFFHNWLGDVTMAYLVALLVTLMIEMPLSALQKLALNKKTY